MNNYRVKKNIQIKSSVELFAIGKPIHPYSLQCKGLHILKYSSPPYTLSIRRLGLWKIRTRIRQNQKCVAQNRSRMDSSVDAALLKPEFLSLRAPLVWRYFPGVSRAFPRAWFHRIAGRFWEKAGQYAIKSAWPWARQYPALMYLFLTLRLFCVAHGPGGWFLPRWSLRSRCRKVQCCWASCPGTAWGHY